MFRLRHNRPKLSIVVVFYNMTREGPRTLLSLVPPYQQRTDGIDYEIIGIEHGSERRVAIPDHPELKTRLKMVVLDDAPVSPVKAINNVVRNDCRGELVMICIDGARLASTHLISQSAAAASRVDNPFVAGLSWHLGPDNQNVSAQKGYNQSKEDALLQSIDWYNNGDRLFEISVLAGSSKFGYFHEIAESNCPVLHRKRFLEGGGYNENFTSPGAGLANLEFFSRFTEDDTNTVVTLIGDGTFHQYHGGIATGNVSLFKRALPEYEAVIGKKYRRPTYQTYFFPRKVDAARAFVANSIPDSSMI